MPLVKSKIGGPVGSSEVIPIPNSAGAGSFFVGTHWKLLFRCPVTRKSFNSDGENVFT